MTYFRAFDFLNAREDIVEKYRSLKTDDDDLIMQLRVVGTFANRMDFGNFPLDTQELQIQFTVNNSNEGKAPVCLVPLLKESKIHESLFVLGSVWNLLSALTFEIKDSDPILSGRNRTYPIMVISMKVQRRSGYYMWNVALPMLSFVVMAFMSHWIPAEDAAGRLSVSVALVLAAAAYKVVLAQMLPAISYVTMLDNYVMWCCFFLFLTVVENGVMSIQERRAYDGLVFGLLASVFALTTLFYALKVFKLAWWRNRQREESMIHWIRKAPSKKLFQILPVSPGTGPEQD